MSTLKLKNGAHVRFDDNQWRQLEDFAREFFDGNKSAAIRAILDTYFASSSLDSFAGSPVPPPALESPQGMPEWLVEIRAAIVRLYAAGERMPRGFQTQWNSDGALLPFPPGKTVDDLPSDERDPDAA